jgi:uncharacterized protein YdhG (YjbR/CyaY superfamily)
MKPTTITAYIADFPTEIRLLLEEFRQTIISAAPGASEIISYGIPTFYLEGNLVHFAAIKNHIGFYPGPSGIEAFKEEFAKYHTAKGSVQFPLNQPLPLKLISVVVEFRVKENLERTAVKKSKKVKGN